MELFGELIKSENYKNHSHQRAAVTKAFLYRENVYATPLSPLSRGET
jgi:hypothetical protein